ncbi:hypothetical protein CYMTET_29913 [Cymbomonas tetramitiformis]|uniref:Uncharacterized protein n=1 Tax=Cymbomonas tetramitiformis TaxID=36881 RepID=A0AAE0KUF5_9CHLO|nr:hypothetical protein CYMTET_29913 [Cymbomonas tetramitiformis]
MPTPSQIWRISPGYKRGKKTKGHLHLRFSDIAFADCGLSGGLLLGHGLLAHRLQLYVPATARCAQFSFNSRAAPLTTCSMPASGPRHAAWGASAEATRAGVLLGIPNGLHKEG